VSGRASLLGIAVGTRWAFLERPPTEDHENRCTVRVLSCGRYWDRTSDLFRVREARYRCANRPFVVLIEVETGFEPVYTALQAVASPLGHSTVAVPDLIERLAAFGEGMNLRADNRARTGDLNLGKVALYQLSYVRGNASGATTRCACVQTLADPTDRSPTDSLLRMARGG
jgi:hypothetical protein